MNVSAAGGQNGTMSTQRLSAEMQAAVLKKQKDVVEEMGNNAVKLVQSARIDPDPGIGRHFNVMA
jgi:hypothetical protein